MRNFIFLFSLLVSVTAVEAQILTKGNRGPCKVSTGIPYTTSMGQCHWQNEVMVGVQSVDPLMIRCARLQVNCDRTAEPKAKDPEGQESRLE